MSRVVRSSKFRHVFGTTFKKENCFDDVRVTRNAWDTDLVSANGKFVAVIYEAQGGGSFAVIPWTSGGKVDPKLPLVAGHKSAVLDIDFNPFNDGLIASASEDCTIKVWGIPDGGLTKTLDTPLQTLNGHRRKVGTVKFNPVANNILASTSTDFSVKIWDIEKGETKFSVDGSHADIIQSCDWSGNGSLLATACKDKKIRVIDPRSQSIAMEAEGHGGVKGSRVIWIGNKQQIFSVGFTKTSEREHIIWDSRNLGNRLSSAIIDSAAGILMPFYDRDVNMLYLAGKGDGNIRYYEMVDEAPFIYFLSEFKSNTPQRGMCMTPKRALNVSECEIARLLKVGTRTIEPISFQVPRKSDIFQDDIYPDCFSGEPALSSSEWASGKTAEQKTRSLAPGFVAKERVVDFNPTQKDEPKPMSEDELRKELDRLTNRVAFLEAEIIKKDAKIKELSG